MLDDNRNAYQKEIAKQARNRSNILVREAKSSYIKEQFEILKHSPKKFWQNVKEVLPDSNTSKKVKMSDSNGISIEDDKIANFMNEYFVNVGKNLVEKMNNPPSVYDKSLKRLNQGFQFRPIRLAEVTKLISMVQIYIFCSVPYIVVLKVSSLYPLHQG